MVKWRRWEIKLGSGKWDGPWTLLPVSISLIRPKAFLKKKKEKKRPSRSAQWKKKNRNWKSSSPHCILLFGFLCKCASVAPARLLPTQWIQHGRRAASGERLTSWIRHRTTTPSNTEKLLITETITKVMPVKWSFYPRKVFESKAKAVQKFVDSRRKTNSVEKENPQKSGR